MNGQRRAHLLADEEEAKQNIQNLRNRLQNMGTILKDLGFSVISKPENVIFFNAPQGLGDYPPGLQGTTFSFNWNEIPKLEMIAQLIQDLRKETSRLCTIHSSI